MKRPSINGCLTLCRLCVCICVLTAILMSSCINDSPDKPDNSLKDSRLRPGDILPAFTITDNSGGILTSPAAFTGKPALIVFFSTRCPDCRDVLPQVQAYCDRVIATGKDRRIICISRAEDNTAVAAYWAANGLTIPYAAIPDRSIYNLFATSGIPRLYFTDSRAQITAVYGPDNIPDAATWPRP